MDFDKATIPTSVENTVRESLRGFASADPVGHDDVIETLDRNLRRIDNTLAFGFAFIGGCIIGASL